MSVSSPAPLHDVLLEALKQGAADVHYVVGSPPIVRLGAEFTPAGDLPVTTAPQAEALAAALLTPAEQGRLRAAQEVVGAYTFPDGLRCRFRVFFQKGVLSLSFRLLAATLPTVQTLRLPKAVARLAELRRGLVVVAGPYGSGRSATVTALLEVINRTRAARIITVESPIEYVLDSVKSLVEQRQVGRDVPTYEEALREALGEDVQVVMAAEVPSGEAATLLLELAAARLVLTMLDDPTAVKAVEHLIALVPSAAEAAFRSALADVLEGVVVQRILPRAAGGQTVVAEVLLGTGPVRAIVRDGKLAQLMNIVQTSRSEGMVSLDQALVEAARSGEVTAAEAERQASDPAYVKSLLARSSGK